MIKLFFIFFLFLFWEKDLYAGALLYRTEQMKAQRQQQGQQEEYEEYQQAQQAGSQGQQAPAAPTYQQIIDQRNQAIAQAIINSHNPSVSTVDGSPVPEPAASSVAAAPPPVEQGSTQVADVVDLSEVWKKLDERSTVWPLLMDDQAKLLTVSEYIGRFQKEGVKINEPPVHYVQMIDDLSQENPQMLQMPFGELIQVLAIMDYDFDNGMNKDELARKVLGEQGYETNKQRFTQQQQQQQH